MLIRRHHAAFLLLVAAGAFVGGSYGCAAQSADDSSGGNDAGTSSQRDSSTSSTGTGTSTSTGTPTSTSTGTPTSTPTGTGAPTSTATGTPTSTATGTPTSTATGTGTTPSTCAITSTGGLPLTPDNFFPSTNGIGTGGYAYSYADKLGSTACNSSSMLCGSGSVAASTSGYAAIGFNLAQAMGMNTVPGPVAATGSGVKYALTSIPGGTGRIIIDNAGTDYCANITTASGTIPWATFNTTCYAPATGMALAGAPMATHINFQAVGGTAAETFDFCVTAISFAP